MDETLKAISRLRRMQSRNPDTLLVCSEFEKLWQEYRKLANAVKIEVITCKECEKRRSDNRDRVRRHREAKK